MSSKKNQPSPVEPVLLIDSEVTRRIRQHARAHPKTEVCGVLIGDDANNAIDIRASIEGTDAAQGGTHVTFTQETWESIYRVKDELYPNDRIVGWYHSHPGFGVFLSEHDMFIQENFFSSPGQVAWVYDPHTDEEGCFGWVSGEVHRLSRISIADKNGDGTERTPKSIESRLPDADEDEEDGAFARSSARQSKPSPSWVRFIASTLTYAAVLVLGFSIAYFLFPRVLALTVDPVTGQILVHDGRPLLPYLDGRVPMPSASELERQDPHQPAPPLAAPASPDHPQAAPPSSQAAPPAPQSTPGTHP